MNWFKLRKLWPFGKKREPVPLVPNRKPPATGGSFRPNIEGEFSDDGMFGYHKPEQGAILYPRDEIMKRVPRMPPKIAPVPKTEDDDLGLTTLSLLNPLNPLSPNYVGGYQDTVPAYSVQDESYSPPAPSAPSEPSAPSAPDSSSSSYDSGSSSSSDSSSSSSSSSD